MNSIGRYDLVAPLSKGGMGAVYLARLVGTSGFEKPCIIKTILPERASEPNFVERFEREAKILVQLNHPGIPQIHDMGRTDNGLLFMAMEHISGVDLARLLKTIRLEKRTLPIEMSIGIVRQMCEALHYAHRKVGHNGVPLEIVHRDVSPHNVMVTFEGECKVIDFGLVKSSAFTSHTSADMVLGKMGYMSPEQALGLKIDPRTDVFSVGLVLWELLTNERAYRSTDMRNMLEQMGQARVASLADIRPNIPAPLRSIVARALERERESRFDSCGDFSRALSDFVHASKMTPVAPEHLGAFVREHCAEEFAQEQKLLSTIFSVKADRANMRTEYQQAVTPAGPHVEKEKRHGTVKTPESPQPNTVLHEFLDSNSSGASDKQKNTPGRRTKAISHHAILAAFALFAVLLLTFGIAISRKFQRSNTRATMHTNALRVVVVQHHPPPDLQPPPTPIDHAATHLVPMTAPATPEWKAIRKGADTYVVLSAEMELRPGDRVVLLGAQGNEKQRQRLGTGAVLAVNGRLASIVHDVKAGNSDELFVAREKSIGKPVARSGEMPNPSSKVVKSESNSNSVKASAQTPEAPPAPSAAPQEVPLAPAPSEVPVAALGAVEAPEPKPVENTNALVKTEAPVPVELKGSIDLAGNLVSIRNSSQVALRNCEIRLSNGKTFRLRQSLASNKTMRISLDEFSSDAKSDAHFQQGLSIVTCVEGVGYFQTTESK
jgi:serine/threonine protein kinase